MENFKMELMEKNKNTQTMYFLLIISYKRN
jgi:hypothetical protein